MRFDVLEPLARLATTAEAIEGLRDLFAAEEPLDDMAARVAATVVAAIPYADAVSITVLSWPDARTVASTHERALELDHHQYASGRGPCLEAAWHRAPVRAVIGDEQHRWPEFVEAAQRVGIRANLSVPLLIDGQSEEQELVGSLNIYSQTASAFDPFDAHSCGCTPLPPVKRSATPAAGSIREKLSASSRQRSSRVRTSTWPKER
jgi:GAF domain-containing protein